MNPNQKPQQTYCITAQQLTVLGAFLSKLPWEQANPHIQMLNSLQPIQIQPQPVEDQDAAS